MTNSIEKIMNKTTFRQKMETLFEKDNHLVLYHADETVKPFLSFLEENTEKNVLFICADEKKARKYQQALDQVEKNKALFLPPEPYHSLLLENKSREITFERTVVFEKIFRPKGWVVFTTPDALLKKGLSPKEYKRFRLHVREEDVLEREQLSRDLVIRGYERVDQVENPGEFAVRGGIVDVYSPGAENPFRIEFFDDEIDSIRSFDPISQKSIKGRKTATLLPCKEWLVEEEEGKRSADILIDEIEKRLLQAKSEQKSALNHLLEQLKNNPHIKPEWLYAASERTKSSILDWFDSEMAVWIDEGDALLKGWQEIFESLKTDWASLYDKGETMEESLALIEEPKDVYQRLKNRKTVQVQELKRANMLFPSTETMDLATAATPRFYGRLKGFADQIAQWTDRDYALFVCYQDESQKSGFQEVLDSYHISYQILEKPAEINLENGRVTLLKSELKEGFDLKNQKVALITHRDVFKQWHKKKSKPKRKKRGKIESFTQLKVGDPIVHETHGVGIYLGIEQIEIEGIKKDFLQLKYAKDDKLYIPVDQMDTIQMYVGFSDQKPKLNRLDSIEWKKTKLKAKKAVEELARELTELYAKRRAAKGHAFSIDDEWVQAFEDKFPYEETEDQQKAIEDVKKDMEASSPMDRLICGDVGYGKTEVAIRAAFKAVMDGKQVAMLVPTTILAQQHYNNFVQRFSDYPMKVEMVSRFRTKKRQEEILKGVKKNQVDILIGTHRLLSKDVKFHDLGLLIIDEEQRFGVKHKEKVKELKTDIDVLTLTATPIPRTLHMSLTGARDMSVIDEPPGNRMPVQTYVMEYDYELIKDALKREMERKGQVYYVYNRVEGIEAVAARVAEQVPEARVEIAHGQMSEVQLETIMTDYVEHKFDILVCTSIIESGMDVSKANTIIIENADQLGLAQLYQLRGRVGRSDELSYAYITYRPNKVLKEEAQKRLKAIKDFTDFGSGFKIAMRDLEIRGAGNILGAEQHGHLMSVGYDLYCKLLDEEVKKLQGIEPIDKTDTSIEITVNAYIPNYYISSEKQKYEFYKKIAGIDAEDDIEEMVDEMIDRYGEPPKGVVNLMDIAYIKNRASLAGIEVIKTQQKGIGFVFGEKAEISGTTIKELIKNHSLKFNPDAEKMTLTLWTKAKDRQLLTEIKAFVDEILHFQKDENRI